MCIGQGQVKNLLKLVLCEATTLNLFHEKISNFLRGIWRNCKLSQELSVMLYTTADHGDEGEDTMNDLVRVNSRLVCVPHDHTNEVVEQAVS